MLLAFLIALYLCSLFLSDYDVRRSNKIGMSMFKLKTIKISGFWQAFGAAAEFKEDVNIIIGKNGSGKTTFMNIVHAVLAVDMDALFENF